MIAAVQQTGGWLAGNVEFAYMASALLFVFGLRRLSKVRTAWSGNAFASLGMAVAIAFTLWLLLATRAMNPFVLYGGIVVGAGIGAVLAVRVQMTSMPELVAFFNGMGGAASALVALAERSRFALDPPGVHPEVVEGLLRQDIALAVLFSILIGGVTLAGSLIAYGKLAGKVSGSRFGPIGSQAVNLLLVLVAGFLFWWAGFAADGAGTALTGHFGLLIVALALGVGLVIPIGGADMPVVISLLNSYSGIAAAATGFVLHNNLLIIAGSLVGAAGLILTRIMCKAMNRSLVNVLFARFGGEAIGEKEGYANVKSAGAEEAAPILEAARKVIIAPGYGLAVAQAQHKARELASLLQKNGCEVIYAIHPVAGRMPGHMNVLLAEADVPYEQLQELDQVNPEFATADVAIVLGANDVANPVAETDPKSPIAGMPVLRVWDARTVMVVKRSLSAGYAGIKNPLFERDNTLMLFGDAKKVLEDLVEELKEL